MLPPIAYIETTIPSFYHDVRTSPDIVARRDWTRSWWAIAPGRYRLVTSEAVIEELEGGISEHAEARLGLVAGLPLLSVEPEITVIVRVYIRHQLMPADPTGDALHLALASYHKCDFLVTWNCLHLANANKFGHIRRVNTMLGLFTPTIATPLELLGGIDVGEGTE
jgi:hypothetical protein